MKLLNVTQEFYNYLEIITFAEESKIASLASSQFAETVVNNSGFSFPFCTNSKIFGMPGREFARPVLNVIPL